MLGFFGGQKKATANTERYTIRPNDGAVGVMHLSYSLTLFPAYLHLVAAVFEHGNLLIPSGLFMICH